MTRSGGITLRRARATFVAVVRRAFVWITLVVLALIYVAARRWDLHGWS